MNYAIASVFRSIQGEGAQLGVPMTFVRLAGCSIGCPQCDTDYRVRRKMPVDAVVAEVAALTPPWGWVWVTGGEPTDRDLMPLRHALRSGGWHVALATAGIRPVYDWDWISVSPHAPGRPVQDGGHEVKLIFALNGLDPAACDPRDYLNFPYRYANDRDWVDANPGWRLSIQAHKVWGLE